MPGPTPLPFGGLNVNDPRLEEGVNCFNREEFFEAHEVWESLWNETYDDSKPFVQGLIQVATAMHHLYNGNMRGARTLYHSGLDLLKPFGTRRSGIDLGKLGREFTQALEGFLDVPYEQLAGRGGSGGPLKAAGASSRAFKINYEKE
jgi:predicted metal-dependent hydrolase